MKIYKGKTPGKTLAEPKGYTGNLYGVNFKVIEDPSCPPNVMYFLSDKFMEFATIKNVRLKWYQRLWNWCKKNY